MLSIATPPFFVNLMLSRRQTRSYQYLSIQGTVEIRRPGAGVPDRMPDIGPAKGQPIVTDPAG
jgi:hypothetical protein